MKNYQVLNIWLSTEEAAEYLSTTPKAILNQVHRGQIPTYKFGRLNRYKREDLDRLLEGGFNKSSIDRLNGGYNADL